MKLLWPLPPEYRECTTPYGVGHLAIDLACPIGTDVYASHAGILSYESTIQGGIVARVTGVDCISRYCHLQCYWMIQGEMVKAGDKIALSDNTGTATTGPHLHYEIRVNGVAVNPLDYVGGSSMKKTSIHFENAPTEAQRQRLAASNLTVVKSVWPFPVIPGKVCISRTWIGGDANEWAYVEQGIAGAQALFARLLPIYQQYPGMYWVILNEPNTSSLANCQKLCVFLVEYARIMHGNGFKIAGLETGEGRPEDNADSTSSAKTAVLGPAYTVMDLITCHGYYCPPQALPDNDWHSVRYRKIYADLHAAGFNTTAKWVIDEAGIDRGVIGASGGYQNIPLTQQQYLPYIQQYDNELCKDAYVLGCTIYTLNPNPSWVTFGYAGWLEDQIYNLAEAQQDDLLTWAETIVIPFNPNAGLWQYIRARGWVPQSQEMAHDGISYQWAFHENKRTLCGWINGAVQEVLTKDN
jgi:hypothetical protein